jgi:hypothetical protein
VSVCRLRRRLPLLAAILLAIFCLGTVSLACSCATDQPGQAVKQAIQSIASAPAVMELWVFFVVVIVLMPLQAARRRHDGRERASPATLQRFLF